MPSYTEQLAEEWSELWILRFPPGKCKVVRISAPPPEEFSYTFCSSTLDWSTAEKDLGIMMDNQLKFSEELNRRVNKANSIMGVICRTFWFLDEETFTRLFVTLVRPHVDYASSVWSPHLKGEIDKVERVYTLFTTFCANVYAGHCWNSFRNARFRSLVVAFNNCFHRF